MSLQSKKFRNRAVIYGICALLCLIKITEMYVFFLIFLALTALYIWLMFKHKNDSDHPLVVKIRKETEERKALKKKEKEEASDRKAEYNAQLAKIEEDFDFDYGDEEDEDE